MTTYVYNLGNKINITEFMTQAEKHSITTSQKPSGVFLCKPVPPQETLYIILCSL